MSNIKNNDYLTIKKINQYFSKPINFMFSVTDTKQFPPSNKIEICFLGRSNVGKSSLINKIFQRKRLTYTSNKPGCTQYINYYNFNNYLYFVDLPGYGYSKIPKNIYKNIRLLMYSYLYNRVTLRRVFLLIDARYGFKKNDCEIMDFLDQCSIPYQIILSKIDKLKKNELKLCQLRIKEKIFQQKAALTTLLKTSSKKLIGIDSIRIEISHIIENYSK